MSHTAQHCFLLDGKTILPIDHNYQLFIPLRIINNIKSINNNKFCQVDEDDLCSRSITKRKIVTAKRNQSDQKQNNIETYLITRIISSINSAIDSTQVNNKELHKSSSPITIIIKPVISSENHHKSLLNKRKNSSSSSLQSVTKRISTSLSNQHRLSTFKDIARSVPTAMTLNKSTSSHIVNSRRLLDIYRNKKQNLIEK